MILRTTVRSYWTAPHRRTYLLPIFDAPFACRPIPMCPCQRVRQQPILLVSLCSGSQLPETSTKPAFIVLLLFSPSTIRSLVHINTWTPSHIFVGPSTPCLSPESRCVKSDACNCIRDKLGTGNIGQLLKLAQKFKLGSQAEQIV